MKIAVVGAGAMGAVFAVHFAEVGHDVLLIQRAGAHLDAIRAQGLRLSGPSADRTVTFRAESTAPAEPQDMVVIAVKATQVAAAARDARRLVGPETVVVAMQNGIGAADLIALSVPADRLVLGIAAAFGARIAAPGHAEHKAMQAIKLGVFGNLPQADLQRAVEAWRGAGFAADAASDIVAMQWEKLICNASFSATCGLSGLTVGAALADKDLGPLCLAAGKEAWTVARGLGVAVIVGDPEAHIRAFAERVSAAKPSLLQDIEAGRSSEIDFINGAVVREAERAGLAAPVNRTLVALVRQREASRR